MAASSNSRFANFPGPFIKNLVFTNTPRLGRGAYAIVLEVEWNGTVCAAKRLHDILFEDDTPGGVEKLVSDFGTECATWAKLRHPGVVQFLGVYEEPGSRLPVLVMEKMDITLRRYLESRTKDRFPLHLKAFVLRQVSQALAFLHNQDPPVVHHDLSSNNVLLNVITLVAKVSDFGMSRPVSLSCSSRIASMKGTRAFMAPEVLQGSKYDPNKLDVFSFGNLVISTVTHKWPEPGMPTRYEGDQLIALNELQCRKHYIKHFTVQEKQLFLPIIGPCLENRPDRRPSSVILVEELRKIESSTLLDCHEADSTEQLRLHLLAKEKEYRQKEEALKDKDEVIGKRDEEIRERDEALREKDVVIGERDEEIRVKNEALREKDAVIGERDEEIRVKNEALREKDAVIGERDEEIRVKNEALREKDAMIRERNEEIRVKNEALREKDIVIGERDEEIRKRDETLREDAVIEASKESDNLSSVEAILQENRVQHLDDEPGAQQAKLPTRSWKALGTCKKVIQHSTEGDLYKAVAVNSEGLLALVDAGQRCVRILTKEGKLKSTIGKGRLGGFFQAIYGSDRFGVSFDLKGNVLVCAAAQNNVVKFSQDGELLQTISYAGRNCDLLRHPWGVCVSPEDQIYICDHDNHSVTVHKEDGRFLHAFGMKGNGPGCFSGPRDVAFGSDGNVYVIDEGNKVCVWSKEGDFQREFKTKHDPFYIAATGDKHLLITSRWSHTVMVYTLEGELVHKFGQRGSEQGRFDEPLGICIDDSGLVYVADCGNKRVQVF